MWVWVWVWMWVWVFTYYVEIFILYMHNNVFFSKSTQGNKVVVNIIWEIEGGGIKRKEEGAFLLLFYLRYYYVMYHKLPLMWTKTKTKTIF